MPRSNWPDQHDAMLRTLRRQDFSFGKIADALNTAFGTNYSRSAIIGRAARLALPRRDILTAARQRESEKRRRHAAGQPQPEPEVTSANSAAAVPLRAIDPVKATGTATRVILAIRKSRRPIRAPQPDNRSSLHCDPVEPLHLSLMDLRRDSCRWPFGDGSITFCGHPVVDAASSYCPAHQARSRATSPSLVPGDPAPPNEEAA